MSVSVFVHLSIILIFASGDVSGITHTHGEIPCKAFCKIGCPFGFKQDECPRCTCSPDPCQLALCPPGTFCSSVSNTNCIDKNEATCPHEARCGPCKEVVKKFIPLCKHGFLPIGCPRKVCAPDPCLFNPCNKNQKCVSVPKNCPEKSHCPHKAVCLKRSAPCPYVCRIECKFGFLLKGCPRCTCAPDPCKPNPCKKGETCSTTPTECKGGYCPHKAVCSNTPLCPDGKPVPTCIIDPCDPILGASCPLLPSAKCVSDYCGGCIARWYIGKLEVTELCKITKKACGACPAVYDPVCGVDGNTYGNLCLLNCAGVKLAYTGECTKKACGACPAVYDPVCGVDGNTYGNLCLLNCAGVKLAYTGECKPVGCPCPLNYDPVCGVDGKTYPNECVLRCGGVNLAYPGECNGGCPCPAVYDPVCGVDGKTYGNLCVLNCAGVKLAYHGECNEGGCPCPAVYDPVCGVDGKTYGNLCILNCAGVKLAYPGECKTKPVDCLCPLIYDPVCGVDGKTYPNECVLKCSGIKLAHKGICGCFCTQEYDPVCGVDGVTYGNLCTLNCRGIQLAYEDECKK